MDEQYKKQLLDLTGKLSEYDEDVMFAAIDLANRSGARGIEIGYLHDGVPVDQAGWYATALYKGARITCEKQSSPSVAADGLARRLLSGAKCAHCGALVTLDPAGAYTRDSTLVDGTPWLVEQQQQAGLCCWTLEGQRWRRGCGTDASTPTTTTTRPGGNRAARRAAQRRKPRPGSDR